MDKLIGIIMLVMLNAGCWPTQTDRPVPDNQKQTVECAFTHTHCDGL